MNIIRLSLTAAATCVLALALYRSAATAPNPAPTNPRTYVSSTGNDSNNCQRANPCKTLQAAHDKTAVNGEIGILDDGNYGPLAITKGISIVNGSGGFPTVLVPAHKIGITINVPPATGLVLGDSNAIDHVYLRGLTIDGAGGGGQGIEFNTGGALTVENCVFRNLVNGIVFKPSDSAALAVSRTLIADNSRDGIFARVGGTQIVKASLTRVELYNNGSNGIYLLGDDGGTGRINVVVADSVAAWNGVGFGARSYSTQLTLLLVNSVAANNRFQGVTAIGSSTHVRLRHSSIFKNASGVLNDSADVLSFGDNSIIDNETASSPFGNTAMQ